MPRDAEARLSIPLEKAYMGGIERIRLESGRSLEVSMPPGMVTGQRIRLAGQGVEGGALYLIIDIQPHSIFRLESYDVHCFLSLTPSEATQGGQFEVPTLDGSVKMLVPADVQTGQRLRLEGKGYPTNSFRQRGDQIVEIQIAPPDPSP